jgi:hypothetical protein
VSSTPERVAQWLRWVAQFVILDRFLFHPTVTLAPLPVTAESTSQPIDEAA